MEIFYFLALIPIGLGLVAKYIFHKNISWQEWLLATMLAFITAGITHGIVNTTMSKDFEIWSGQVIQAKHYTAWQEYYEEAIYRDEDYEDTETYTDSKGKSRTRTVTKTRRVFDHWESRTRWHSDSYDVSTTLNSFSISKSKYEELKKEYKNESSVLGDRTTSEHNSRMIAGDRYDRISNAGNVITPITCKRSVENRLLHADKNVYSFAEIPEGKWIQPYPASSDPFTSNRLINVPTIQIKDWDILNSTVGPVKKVNLILINFSTSDTSELEYVKSKWIGGKKNDLILCKGVGWTKVFGWSDADICKRNLETILLKNELDKNIIPLIEKEVMDNYEKTNWHKFDHIAIEPTATSIVVYIIIMLLIQGGVYYYFHTAEIDIVEIVKGFIKR